MILHKLQEQFPVAGKAEQQIQPSVQRINHFRAFLTGENSCTQVRKANLLDKGYFLRPRAVEQGQHVSQQIRPFFQGNQTRVIGFVFGHIQVHQTRLAEIIFPHFFGFIAEELFCCWLVIRNGINGYIGLFYLVHVLSIKRLFTLIHCWSEPDGQ